MTATETTCRVCGKPVDLTAPYRYDPEATSSAPPLHYDCGEQVMLRMERTRREDRLRLERAAPALLAALQRLLAEADDDGITQDGVDAAFAAIAALPPA